MFDLLNLGLVEALATLVLGDKALEFPGGQSIEGFISFLDYEVKMLVCFIESLVDHSLAYVSHRLLEGFSGVHIV